MNPIASHGVIETRSRLPEEIGWIRLEHIPVFRNQVAVHHIGTTETRLTNESGPSLLWRAVFPGRRDRLTVDGRAVEAHVRDTAYGRVESYVEIDVDRGETRIIMVR